MNFVCPLPPIKVLVRPEYLYDFQCDVDAPLVEGIWCSVKAIKGEAFRFETYLPEYGALYDKLPISAFYWVGHSRTGGTDLPLDILQIWDSLSYHVTVVDKPLLKGLRAEFFAKDKVTYGGEYLFTLDTCSPDPRIPDFTFSETIDEHKSYNVLKLDNGQFALQPNNRCRFFDPAFNPADMRFPDFKVATRKYRVEQHAKWRLGDVSGFTYDNRTEPGEVVEVPSGLEYMGYLDSPAMLPIKRAPGQTWITKDANGRYLWWINEQWQEVTP